MAASSSPSTATPPTAGGSALAASPPAAASKASSTGKVVSGYQWAEVVGRGTWGKVRRVIHLASGTEAAVKIVYRMRISRKIRRGLALFYQ